ncbi:MAG: AI-2E family transporter [Phycisphaerae bacterium]
MATPPSPSASPTPRPPLRIRSLLPLGIWLIALTLFIYFFHDLRPILLDLLLASAIACMLRPLLQFIPGPHWLRGTLVGIGFLLLFAALLFGLGWLLKAPILHELKLWPKLHENLDHLFHRWGNDLGMDNPPDVNSLLNRITSYTFGAGSAGHVLSSAADFLSQLAVTLALVFVGMLYLLVEPAGKLTAPLAQPLPSPRREQLQKTFSDLDFRLRHWLLGVLISVALVGSLSWVGYYFVGLQFALPLAIFAGCAEIVPTVGALTASLVAILVAATQNSTFTLVGVIVVHSFTLFLEAYVIVPLLMRKAIRVPPAVTLFTVVLWSKLLGLGGLILALPLDLLLWTLYDNFLLSPRRKHPPPSYSYPTRPNPNLDLNPAPHSPTH